MASLRRAHFLRAAPLIVLAVLAAASPTLAAPLSQVQGQQGLPLSMLSQSSWVGPGQKFAMTLAVRSNVDRSQLGVALTAYAPPEGQSSFEETLTGNTSSERLLTDTPTIPLTSLTSDPQGNLDIHVGITAGDAQAPSSTFELNLECEPESCSGVYPLRVQLMDTAKGSVIASLVTHIVFVESNVSSKLRVALVVPAGAAPSGTTQSGAPTAPDGSQLTRLNTLMNELGNSTAPVTVLPQPQSVQALAGGSSAAKSVASGIVSISDTASAQVLNAPYVWVDPRALVDSGNSSEIPRQLSRGAAELAETHVQASGNTSIVDDGLDSQTLAALQASGITQVVIPSDDLAPVSGRFAGPPVQTFELKVGHGRTLEAAQSEPAFQSELSDEQGSGGVLAAHQLLADLALVAFEEPDASWARGVVLAPGLKWSPSPGFLTTLLSGLASVPVLDPVTLSSFFAQVTPGNDGGNPDDGDGWPLTEALATGAGTAPSFPTSALATARTKLGALESLVSAGAVNLTPLGDTVLSAECVLLSFNQQVAALNKVDKLVSQRAAVVSLTAYRTIRITSQTATIPITLVRKVPYPVTVELHLSSDKLGFLHGTNPQRVKLTRRLQSVNVDVFARTAGDFPVAVTVSSPKGGLLVTSATFTVRSLSTSVVAIVLSACAAAVLLFWWARTLVSGRRDRRGRSGRGVHSTHHEGVTPAITSSAGTEP